MPPATLAPATVDGRTAGHAREEHAARHATPPGASRAARTPASRTQPRDIDRDQRDKRQPDEREPRHRRSSRASLASDGAHSRLVVVNGTATNSTIIAIVADADQPPRQVRRPHHAEPHVEVDQRRDRGRETSFEDHHAHGFT